MRFDEKTRRTEPWAPYFAWLPVLMFIDDPDDPLGGNFTTRWVWLERVERQWQRPFWKYRHPEAEKGSK